MNPAITDLGKVAAVADSRWIELDGAVNARDLGGLPTVDGGQVQPNRLIRTDNLQDLSAADVRLLVDDRQVRAVADLRTRVELDGDKPGPMTHEPLVRVEHYSLFPEVGRNTDVAALNEQGPSLLPWQKASANRQRGDAAVTYRGYLEDRSDSAMAALRLIAHTDGATIVHCAAGKDRTGVIVALALSEVGVTREAIVEDYAMSSERIELILARLRASGTYKTDLAGKDADKLRTRPETMERLLGSLDEDAGGVPVWLRAQGWTDADATALRSRLLN